MGGSKNEAGELLIVHYTPEHLTIPMAKGVDEDEIN